MCMLLYKKRYNLLKTLITFDLLALTNNETTVSRSVHMWNVWMETMHDQTANHLSTWAKYWLQRKKNTEQKIPVYSLLQNRLFRDYIRKDNTLYWSLRGNSGGITINQENRYYIDDKYKNTSKTRRVLSFICLILSLGMVRTVSRT